MPAIWSPFRERPQPFSRFHATYATKRYTDAATMACPEGKENCCIGKKLVVGMGLGHVTDTAAYQSQRRTSTIISAATVTASPSAASSGSQPISVSVNADLNWL